MLPHEETLLGQFGCRRKWQPTLARNNWIWKHKGWRFWCSSLQSYSHRNKSWIDPPKHSFPIQKMEEDKFHKHTPKWINWWQMLWMLWFWCQKSPWQWHCIDHIQSRPWSLWKLCLQWSSKKMQDVHSWYCRKSFLPKMPPVHPYNLQSNGPHIQKSEANALMNIKGPWVSMMPQSATDKLTINIFVCSINLP